MVDGTGISLRQAVRAREVMRDQIRWGRDHVEAGNLATALDYLRSARMIRELLGCFGLGVDPTDLAHLRAFQQEINAAAAVSA